MRAGSRVPSPSPTWPLLRWERCIRRTGGICWSWSGMARAARWGLEVTLLAAVDVEEGGVYP
ncbi:MAG: hypothetical protein OXC13_07735 [Caldilineaceae bacterium]|nr:hypothetical protein [Caldilineaceae bacterium]